MQVSPMPDLYGINYQQGILLVFNDEKFKSASKESLIKAINLKPNFIADNFFFFKP